MNKENNFMLQNQGPGAKLIFSVLAVIIVGLFFQMIGLGLAKLLFNVSVLELSQTTGDISSNQIHAFKLIQIVGALGTFVFSSLLISRFYTGSWYGFFQFRKISDARVFILLVLIMITALPFVNLLTDINQNFTLPNDSFEGYFRKLEKQTEDLMMTLLSAGNIGALLVNLFMIGIIPAVGEELVFRGLIQKHLTDLFKNAHFGIVLAAIVFSLAHFQLYSFLPRFFLGLILGYMYFYGRNIWYPIIAHLLNNGLGVVFYYFYMKKDSGERLEELGTMELLPITAALSFIAVAVMMYLWVKLIRTNEPVELH